MKCSQCNAEFDGKFCPQCGAAAPEETPVQPESVSADTPAVTEETPKQPENVSADTPVVTEETPNQAENNSAGTPNPAYENAGAPTPQPNQGGWNQAGQMTQPQPSKKGKGCLIAVLVTVAIVIIAGVIGTVVFINSVNKGLASYNQNDNLDGWEDDYSFPDYTEDDIIGDIESDTDFGDDIDLPSDATEEERVREVIEEIRDDFMSGIAEEDMMSVTSSYDLESKKIVLTCSQTGVALGVKALQIDDTNMDLWTQMRDLYVMVSDLMGVQASWYELEGYTSVVLFVSDEDPTITLLECVDGEVTYDILEDPDAVL